MMTLKRGECSILSLVLTRKWYEMIDAGLKREEYRADTLYWRRRLANWDLAFNAHNTPVVEFRLGYASNAPRMAFWTFGLETASGMRPYAHKAGSDHPEWGEPDGPHFIIRLGGRIELTKESEAAK